MDNFLTNSIPLADWVESATDWITNTFSGAFNVIQNGGQALMDGITNTLLIIPPLLMIALLTIAAFLLSKKKWGFPTFVLIGLLYIYNQNLWDDLMNTVTLVLVATLLSVIIGIPLGIWMAKSNRVEAVIKPLLDFMQTMPSFVYLIPAVAFFGIGVVPGVFASIIFALPPTVRMTNLGIRQVPTELVEASDSFGGTPQQKLFKLELPLAKSTILAGVNQTLMLALSMVVTASMIGAPGLGKGVLSALQRSQVGNGFVNGLALVVLAIIVDRFTQMFNRPSQAKSKEATAKRKRYSLIGAAVAVVAIIGAIIINSTGQNNKTVTLAYVEWDSEVASTNVAAKVLENQGYNVKLVALDNSVMWKSVSNGEADATLSAWLPSTHAEQYAKYKNSLNNLGPNLKGAKLGLVVPSYTDVDSIEDLSNEADQTITGIEPGAGVMTAAQKTIDDYPNLSGWQLQSSSSGAMTTALNKAIKNKEDIIITGWTPHWMFAKYDLKYLKDPKGTMGGEESINTMARKGLKKDMPEVYKILDNFYWKTDDIEEVMLDINSGTDPEKAAEKWVNKNKDKVSEWTK
ncbi:ABC transporter permease/substrate binding protein [Streptococcus dentapri]|uniref:ABC transporter permease/substrate binding protein n=1 Tax=Streptococcus dentapri TaxID=573564 RepID=A0ABV8CZN6_9STRE